MQQVKSETFYATQGLPNDTEIDLQNRTKYMRDFIAQIVGEPISLRKRVSHVTVDFTTRTCIET